MQDFRKLDVWQRAHDLTLLVYDATRTFPHEERYGLTAQLRRGSTSIPTNIAEACGRGSRADMSRFLQIAMGSASELQYLLILSRDLRLIATTRARELLDEVTGVKRRLSSLTSR
ncbi:MAG: four helix bundle protein, partial [Planctomycetota bacterium]